MTSTGQDIRHRTHRRQGPFGAHTAVRLTVQQYAWPAMACLTVKPLPTVLGGVDGGLARGGSFQFVSVPRP
jgi:hypothetical protein